MHSPSYNGFPMDTALARRLGRPASRRGSVGSGDLGRFAARLDGVATASFTATALFGAVVIFSILESTHSAAAAAWTLTAAMAACSAALILMWRSNRERRLRLEVEIERLQADIERGRRQLRGEAAFFGAFHDGPRYD